MRFEVLATLKVSIFVFWVVTPCGLIGIYQGFGEIYCLHLQGWRWRRYSYVSPKPWYLPTSQHAVTTQKTNIDMCYVHVSLTMDRCESAFLISQENLVLWWHDRVWWRAENKVTLLCWRRREFGIICADFLLLMVPPNQIGQRYLKNSIL
jgi:hypothetical protein